MRSLLLAVFNILSSWGGLGLLALGLLDSSFLFLPLGNDLLMLALTSAHPSLLAYYAAMATGGSLAGCFVIDIIARKGGEQGLSKLMPANRIEYVKRKVVERAGWALTLAALLPPPFPFTPFVAAAAALQHPRRQMFPVLACARYLRFAIIGLLAVNFGPRIQQWAQSPYVQMPLIGLLVLCVCGSVWSVWGWVRRSRQSA